MTEYTLLTTEKVEHGGMGDVLVHCFREGAPFGYFKALKARGDSTRLVLTSHRPYMDDLFTGNPYIDKMDREVRGNWLTPQDTVGLTWERPEFYLDDAEKAVVESFGTDYLAVHPWSTQPRKIVPLDIPRLIVPLCLKGQRVVLLGGTYHGSYYTHHTFQQGVTLIENFEGFEHPLFLNAVNKLSVRAQTLLVSRAAKFIGSQSAYACAAQIYGIPSLIVGWGDGALQDVGYRFRRGPVTHFPHPMMTRRSGVNEAINQFLGDAVMPPSPPVQVLQRRLNLPRQRGPGVRA